MRRRCQLQDGARDQIPHFVNHYGCEYTDSVDPQHRELNCTGNGIFQNTCQCQQQEKNRARTTQEGDVEIRSRKDGRRIRHSERNRAQGQFSPIRPTAFSQALPTGGFLVAALLFREQGKAYSVLRTGESSCWPNAPSLQDTPSNAIQS